MSDASIPVQQIDEGVYVAPQLSPDAMAAAAAAGFKSVMNNRPDMEGGADQPSSSSVQIAAIQAGLTYAHLPVQGGYQSPEDIAACAQLLKTLPRPLLMFCRSGARSTRLYQLASESES
jgi:uncharacterized protein (TIGR01244 family)